MLIRVYFEGCDCKVMQG